MEDPVCGMHVEPSSAIKLKLGTEQFYFCSRHCAEKFFSEKTGKALGEKDLIYPAQSAAAAGFFKRKLVLASFGFLLLLPLSYTVDGLRHYRHEFLMYAGSVWWAILLGLLIGGFIDFCVPSQFISSFLAGNNKRSILRAVASGLLMSACSHGILALAIQLHKKGASVPAVIAFLLASPWANLPFTFILFGFFGAKALFLVFAATAIAVITGFIYQYLEHKGWIESNPNTIVQQAPVFLVEEVRKHWAAGLDKSFSGIFKGAIALGDMVIWWMIIGIGLASLAAVYIPEAWFTQYMGPHFKGLLVTLAFATVIEVCSEGTAPLAFEIFRRTGGFGNALVFLLAGVATDYTEIGLLWSNVGRRTALWLPVITVPQIILFGLLANALF